MSQDDLERFVDAQDDIYDRVVAELRAGRKTSHWMWFVFPQIEGLGSSAMARHYAIASRAEAEAYLGHPVLGPRLRELTRAVMATAASSLFLPESLAPNTIPRFREGPSTIGRRRC